MSEVSDIVADLRENLAFLQELGVEGLAVDLPAFDDAAFGVRPRALSERQAAEAGSSRQSPAPQQQPPPARNLEKFVPSDDLVRKPNPSRPPAAERPPAARPASRRELLQKTQLKNVQQKAAETAPDPDAFGGILKHALPMSDEAANIPAQGLVLRDKTPMAEPLENTMFGDIKQRLPENGETIDAIRDDIGNCTRCPLHEGRTKIVHSTGNREAKLMFIGEAPGADEDARGEPFVGRAGQLLTKIIEGIKLGREDVFIGNINRCRPPGNRQPTLPEAHTCRPFLLREIAVVRPKVIVVLGNTACQNLLDTKVGITKLRGHFHDYFGVKVMPTFHPAYLLRDPSKKREVWEDMKKVRDYLAELD